MVAWDMPPGCREIGAWPSSVTRTTVNRRRRPNAERSGRPGKGPARRPALQEAEIDFDGRGHRHGRSILHAGAELPLSDGFRGFLIQTESEALLHLNVMGKPVGPNHDL